MFHRCKGCQGDWLLLVLLSVVYRASGVRTSCEVNVGAKLLRPTHPAASFCVMLPASVPVRLLLNELGVFVRCGAFCVAVAAVPVRCVCPSVLCPTLSLRDEKIIAGHFDVF